MPPGAFIDSRLIWVCFISVENVGQTLVCPAVGQAEAYPTTHPKHPQ